MKKLNLLIAALHAGALALVAGPGLARAQDTAEVRAYMNALSAGTAEAMSQFLELYPNSALPGSGIGASMAGGVSEPTGGVKDGGTPRSWTGVAEEIGCRLSGRRGTRGWPGIEPTRSSSSGRWRKSTC